MLSVFKTQLIGSTLIFVFLAQICFSQVEPKRLPSLDSVTPGVVFEKLPSQQAEASITNMSAQLAIGDVRSGRAYEIEVVLQNSLNEALKPLSATTSCNCIVGTIENQLILPNEKGSLLLRIHVAKHDVNQMARIEFKGKLFFDVTLTGRVIPDFAFDQIKDIYHEDLVAKANTVVDLKPQYPDIDLSSVDIVATQGFLKVEKLESKNDSVNVHIAQGDLKNVFPAREVLEVRFKTRDAKQFRSQLLELNIASNAVVARPKMIRLLVAKNSEDNGFTLAKMDLNLCNLPPNTFFSKGETFSLSLNSNADVYEALLETYTMKNGVARCELTVRIPSEKCNSLVLSREWVGLSVCLGSIRVDGIKCVFVSGE